MKLALLGIDRWVRHLAEAVAHDEAHEISVVCDAGELAADVLQQHPAAHRESDWENLLLARNFDVLVVGTHCETAELRAEQLKRLVQEAVPLVLVQPAAEAIVLHEQEMIQRDTGSLLETWNPVLGHPALREVQRFVEQVEAAEVTHVSIQRSLDTPTWSVIQTQLACDAEWISRRIGPPDRVTALAPGSGKEVLSNLAVTFVSQSDAIGQWTLGGPNVNDTMTISGSFGQAVCRSTTDGGAQLNIDTQDGSQEQSWTADQLSAEIGADFRAFAEAALQRNINTSFEKATRAVELAEAAKESNRRNRTIAMHYEEHSEQQTFKSVMAAGGCLLLMLLLLTCFAGIALDSIGAPFRNNQWLRIWPAYVLAPVVLFLLLQTLWRVFAAPRNRA